MSKLAEQYEAEYPGTGCSEPQKEERMERELHKRERLALRRTTRNRGIVVPTLPWKQEA